MKEHREFFEIDMESGWQPIGEGIEAKVLAGSIDTAGGRGNLNRIVRWAPDAHIDEVRVHDFHEEVLIVRGSLMVAAQEPPHAFETFRALTFACRPPGARHGPFRAGPEGCVLFETQYYV